MRESLDMIAEEGLENVWNRHATLARAVWAAFEAWGQGTEIALNIADPAHRSHAVTTVRLGADHGDRLRAWLEQTAGITLGIPLGQPEAEAPGSFRIGHMGHVNAHMVMGVLGCIQAGMIALDIPHGPGGVEAAARVIAGQ
jgi:alanine-glyoxylate transaminase/serine-glyoxylate transaminase/serine-pyruvate transaminase